MATITLNLDDAVATKFRLRAADKYGKKKGYLGKAAAEAFVEWAESEADLVEQALAVIKKGMKLSDWQYKKRSELYEGSHRY